MKKYPTIAVVILILSGATFYLWRAVSARQESDDVMSKFKEIDKSLSLSTDSTHVQKGVSAVEKIFPISLMKSELILLIDSLKENYENIPGPSRSIELSKQVRPDIKRLLRNIQQLNNLKKDRVDSGMPDTVKYWSALDKFSEQKWFSMYFLNAPKEVSITYLNYLRNQILTNN